MSNTKKSVKDKKSADGARTVCGFGRAGLILWVVIVIIWVILCIADIVSRSSMSSSAITSAGLLFLFSFLGVILFITPMWLIVGIVCLAKSRKVLERDRVRLKVLGVLNVVNAVMAWFLAVGGAFASIVGVIYSLAILVWLIQSSKTAKGSRSKKQELIQDQASYRVLVVIVLVIVAIVLLFGLISAALR